MHAAQFEEAAFSALLDTCGARELRLQAVTIDERMMAVLLGNTRLESLSLMGVALRPEQVSTLGQHSLRINDLEYPRRS
jgi:hypothetical protein